MRNYIEPSFCNTTSTVFKRILISSPIFQLSIYSLSSLTTSSKSVISLRPLTCHIPVIPGLIASLTLCLGSYKFVSEISGGLVPTIDISPPYVKSGTTLDIKKEPLITQKPFLLVRSHKQNIYSFYFLFHIQLYIHYLRNFSSIFLSLSSNGIRFSYTTGSKRISFCNLCIAKSKSSSFATSSCFTSSSISSRLLNI